MTYNSEDKAAYVLFTRAIEIDSNKVTKEDIKDFLSEKSLNDNEQRVVEKLGNSKKFFERINQDDFAVEADELEITEDHVIASYNRSSDQELPDDLNKLIENKRRELLEDDEDDESVDEDKLDDN